MKEGIIYKITNTVNGKSYIGKTCSKLSKRWGQHVASSRSGKQLITRAINKYGKEAFVIETIAESLGCFLNDLEIFYIKLFRANDRRFGYNRSDGGEGCSGISFKRSVEDNLAKSVRQKGRKHSENTIEKFKRPKSDEHKRRISEALSKRIAKPETRAKRSASMKRVMEARKARLG